jgi:hypothetical protein
MTAFYLPDGDRFLATPLTGGPWDERLQHGGPPSALLAGAMARASEGFTLAKFSVDLLRPVPIGPVDVAVRIDRAGRTVQRLSGTLSVGGRPALQATALAIRHAETPAAGPTPPAWPDPDSLPEFTFPFFGSSVGYHRAVDLRQARGTFGTTPVAFWARSRVPLVADRPLLPIEQVLILADAQSGMGTPLNPEHHSFVNPDLVVHLARAPLPGWLGFDIHSVGGAEGAGWSASELRDAGGLLGRSAQSLVIRTR